MATRRRTRAEWATFAIASLVLGIVIALLLTELMGTSRPASPIATVRTAEIEVDGDRHRVPVSVRNRGDRAATDIQVVAELEHRDGTETADQTIDFLGADETADLAFLFSADPREGDLIVTVTGYAEP